MTNTPDYTIALDGERSVPLLFKTWATKHFCLEQGFKVEEMYGNLQVAQIDAILLKGHECYCLYHDLPQPKLTEKDTCDWVDALGGYNGPKTQEVLEIFLAKSAGKTVAEYRKIAEVVKMEPKKKKESESVPNG